MPDAVVTVAEVKAFRTQSGKTRFVLRDDEGRGFTTFREQIAATRWQPSRPSPGDLLDRLRRLFAGRLVERLDGVEIDGCRSVAPRRRARGGRPPEELFERLQPFKERVAEDIRGEPEDAAD